MADSKRQGHKPSSALNEELLVKKERVFLVTFFLGGVALVAGMFWIADGLSTDFKVTSTNFIILVTAAALSITSALLSKFLLREK